MQTTAFDRLDLLAIGFGLIVAVAFWLTSGVASAASALAGCAVSVLNFAAMRFILGRLLGSMKRNEGGAGYVGLFMVKLLGLVGLIFLLSQLTGNLDGMAFAAGFVSVLFAATVAGLVWKNGLLGIDVSEDSTLGDEANA